MRLVFVSDPSHEFPQNTKSLFKTRLPKPLVLEGRWQVALVGFSCAKEKQGLTLDIEEKLELTEKVTFKRIKDHVNQHSGNLMRWRFKKIDDSAGTSTFKTIAVPAYDMNVIDYLPHFDSERWTEQEFLKFLFDNVRTRIYEELEDEDHDYYLPISQVPHFDPWEDHFSWDGDDLIVKARRISDLKDGSYFAFWQIRLDIAKMLRWVFEDLQGHYQLGINAQPWMPNQNGHVYGFPEELEWGANAHQSPFLVATDFGSADLVQYFQPSMAVNWRFTRVNSVIRSLFDVAAETSSSADTVEQEKGQDRSLMVYTDIIHRTEVGHQLTNMLREIPMTVSNAFSHFNFEPKHKQWMDVKDGYIQTVEMGVFEADGRRASFVGDASTKITVEFRQLPPGS